VRGDPVVHECPPLEVYVLQPAPRDMPMSIALSVRSPLQSISELERSGRGLRKGGTRSERMHRERYRGPRVGYPSRVGLRSRTLSASSVAQPPGEPGPVSRTRGLGQGLASLHGAGYRLGATGAWLSSAGASSAPGPTRIDRVTSR